MTDPHPFDISCWPERYRRAVKTCPYCEPALIALIGAGTGQLPSTWTFGELRDTFWLECVNCGYQEAFGGVQQ